MAQEEYLLGRCHSGGGSGGGGGGGWRPKKTKQKKAPQRGLGVAQLEKIILEEKQKKGYFGNNIGSDDSCASPFLAIHPNSFSSVSEGGLREGNEIWPKSWGGEYNNHNNNLGSMSHKFIAFEPQLNLVYANGPHQFQRPASSPLEKYSPGISTVISTQMEPPSIPSVHYKNSVLTEEHKMISMMKKRPYPFSIDHTHPIISSSTSDELASFANHQQQYTLHLAQPRNKLIRESVSNKGPFERNLNEAPIDGERLNGKFLTLAPPSVASPPLKPVHKHALDYLGRPRHELSDNQCIPGQGYVDNNETERAGPSGSCGSYFSLFPVDEMRSSRNTAYVMSSGDGEKEETIDLSLKL